MAQIIWTEPAQTSLDAIADYIALDNPVAARELVRKISNAVKQLARFPRSGSRIPEASHRAARQLIIKPCRIFYRSKGQTIFILHVMRQEQLFRREFIG